MNAPAPAHSTTQLCDPKDVRVCPVAKLHPDVVQEYWQTLYSYGLLQDRLTDIVDPTWSDVLDLIRRTGQHMYCAVDSTTSPQDPTRVRVIGEFALTNFTGKAAQIHFSMHPENTLRDILTICSTIADGILLTWAEQARPEVSYLKALVGLTPVTNRAACITVLKAGFVKKAVIPGAVYMAKTGEYVDGMLSLRLPTEGLAHGRWRR